MKKFCIVLLLIFLTSFKLSTNDLNEIKYNGTLFEITRIKLKDIKNIFYENKENSYYDYIEENEFTIVYNKINISYNLKTIDYNYNENVFIDMSRNLEFNFSQKLTIEYQKKDETNFLSMYLYRNEAGENKAQDDEIIIDENEDYSNEEK